MDERREGQYSHPWYSLRPQCGKKLKGMGKGAGKDELGPFLRHDG